MNITPLVTPVRESAGLHIPYFCSNPIYEQRGWLRLVSFASRVRVVSSASCCRISSRRDWSANVGVTLAENARVKNAGVKISRVDCRDEQRQRTCYEKPKVKSRFSTPNRMILVYQATPLFPCVELIYDNWCTRTYRSSTAVDAVGNNMADFWMDSGEPYEGDQNWQEQFCGWKLEHVIQRYACL